MTRTRAHTDAEKQARRESILSAAARLFAAHEYPSVTMSKVAAEAGVAKGTLYLYFRTKEELFLELLVVEFEMWFDALRASLPRYGTTLEPRRLATLIASLLSARPELIRLVGLMHTVLEQNIDAERAVSFKLRILELSEATSRAIERCTQGLAPGRGQRFLMQLHVLIVGLGQMTNPSPAVREALEGHPELREFVLDFEAELATMTEALLHHLIKAD